MAVGSNLQRSDYYIANERPSEGNPAPCCKHSAVVPPFGSCLPSSNPIALFRRRLNRHSPRFAQNHEKEHFYDMDGINPGARQTWDLRGRRGARGCRWLAELQSKW